GRQRVVRVAERSGLIQDVDDDLRRRQQRRLDFLFLGVIGADCGDEGSRLYRLRVNDRAARRRAGDDDVAGCDGAVEVIDGPDGSADDRRHFERKTAGRGRVAIERVDFGDRPDGRDAPELNPPLRSTPGDRHRRQSFARQIFGGDGGGRAGALNRNLDRIHHGERRAVGQIGEDDDALYRRQAEALAV